MIVKTQVPEKICRIMNLNTSDDGILKLQERLKVPTNLKNPVIYYVSRDGNDDNDGKTIDKAWKTIQHALDAIVCKYNIINQNITIKVSSGVWEDPIYFHQYNRTENGIINFSGSGSYETILKISKPYSVVFRGGSFVMSNLKILCDSDSIPTGPALCVDTNTILYLSNTQFSGNWPDGGVCSVNSGSFLTIQDNCVWDVVAGSALQVSTFGRIVALGSNISFGGIYNLATIYVSDGVVTWSSSPCLGSCEGKRFLVRDHGTINTGGRGLNFFPGSEPGVIDATSYGIYF